MIDDDELGRIRDDMDRLGWSQRDLADKALVGESTIFRLLKGQYSTKTLRKVQRALGIDATDATALAAAFARIEYGGYSRELYAYYEQEYVCLRPSFAVDGDASDNVTVYPLSIYWDGERGALMFRDRNAGYEQSGVITVPTGTQFLHFVTLDRGSARLMTAYHMPENDPVIRGMVMTFANPRGRQLQPVAAPIVMLPIAGGAHAGIDVLVDVAEIIPRSDPRLAGVSAVLASMSDPPLFLAP
ncbi:MAG: helix-turn-helix transcriptional regulator [Pseudomonadota bacterium]